MKRDHTHINWPQFVAQWERLPHGEKSGYLAHLEREYGIKEHAFYAHKRKIAGKSKSVSRAQDERKIAITKIVMEMKERGKQRSDDPRELATSRCLARLEQRGIIQAGEISASHCNLLMREHFRYREKTPRVRWECEYALQEVQADGSTSKFFRPWKYDENTGDVLLKASGRALSYRKGDEREKIILWQYQDKYSRLRTVRGFPAKAESAEIMLSHMKFWLNRPEDEHPFRHIPWELATDNGSLYKTDAFNSIVRSLELRNRFSKAYEKTGIGSIENRWKVIWQHELMWSEDYPQIWLSEYNMLLHEAMIAEQAEDHPVLAGKKGQLYQMSILRQDPRPRVLEHDLFELVHDTFERTVTAELAVSIHGDKYRVPQYVEGIDMVGRKVKLHRNWRGEWLGCLLDQEDVRFGLTEFEYRLKGDFSGSFVQTRKQKIEADIAGKRTRYEAIIAGDATLTDTGDVVDAETGEIIEEAVTMKLQPPKKVAEPKGPFTQEQVETEGSFENVFQAKTWIGKQLSPFNLTYADVASHFDSTLVHHYELDKARIKNAVALLRSALTKTG